MKTLATPAGLEPATCRLEGGCSIQLSYGADCVRRVSGHPAAVISGAKGFDRPA